MRPSTPTTPLIALLAAFSIASPTFAAPASPLINNRSGTTTSSSSPGPARLLGDTPFQYGSGPNVVYSPTTNSQVNVGKQRRQFGTVDSSKTGNVGALNEGCVECPGAPNDQDTNVLGLGIDTDKTADSRVADNQILPLYPTEPTTPTSSSSSSTPNDPSLLSGLGLDLGDDTLFGSGLGKAVNKAASLPSSNGSGKDAATGGDEDEDASPISSALESILKSIDANALGLPGGSNDEDVKQVGGDGGEEGPRKGFIKLSFLPYRAAATALPKGLISCPAQPISLSSLTRRSSFFTGPTPIEASSITSDTSDRISQISTDPNGTPLVAICLDVEALGYEIPEGTNICPEDRKAYLDLQSQSEKKGIYRLCEAISVLP